MKEIIILLCIIFLISIYLFKEQSESVDLFGGLSRLNGLDGLANSQTDNTPNIKLINKFIQQNPGAKLFYVRDSADFMLTTNTWVFLYDPYNPTNPYGSTLANLDGSRIFGNNMIFQIKPIKLTVQNSLTYTKSFYRLNVSDINGQDLFINFIVNLIQVQLSNPEFTLDNTPISSIKLKLGDIKLTNLVSVPQIQQTQQTQQTQIKECFSGYSDLIGSSMATGSTGLERPTKDSGLPDLDDFFKIFPGAQAYYISKSFSPSVLSSNTIVYLFNPSNPADTNGTQLATGNGTPFFNGEYPLLLNVNKDRNIYGPDILSDQYTENINTYIKDGYTLFDVIPYHELIPIQTFKFSILARKVPNGTWIN